MKTMHTDGCIFFRCEDHLRFKFELARFERSNAIIADRDIYFSLTLDAFE